MSLYDMNPLDDEEERKKREAIAARMDEEAYANPVGPVNPSFLDRVGTAVGNRFDQAMDRVSNAGNALMNPADAITQRMMGDQRQEQADEAANTEVQTTTTKQFADGSKERTVKTQEPAGQTQGESKLTTPIAGMPANLPAQGAISPEQANAPVAMAQLPKPGPAVQVAGQTQMPAQPQQRPPLPTGAVNPANYSLASGQGQAGMRLPQQPLSSTMLSQAGPAPGASLAQMGANASAQPTLYTPTVEREVAQPAAWVQAANDAGSDLTKLLDVAAKHPESRSMILEKTKLALQNKTKEDEANAIMVAAQNGDLKAMNKIQQAIKPETGKAKEEVTVNDYLKAVLYKRLGLDAMAADIQNKIIGKDTKFGQATIGGTNWETETDSSGKIIRAKDDEGNIATEATLNKLRANSTKAGTHAYGFTGEAATIPVGQADAGQEYRQRTNAISGAIENVITTGPNAGKIYGGPPGAAKSVGTSYSKALNDAYIKFQTAPTAEMAKKMMEIAGQVDDGSGRTIAMVNDRIRQMTPGIFNQITSGAAGTPPAPTNVGTGAPTGNIDAQRLQRDYDAVSREISRLPANEPAGSQRRQILENERNTIQQQLAQTGVGAPTTTTNVSAQGGGAVGGSLAGRLKAETEAAGEIGTDLGKIKANQPKAEANADYLLTKINELITHPGFSVSVGASVQPGFQFLPGTDKASWYQRFEEVKGQSFLQGIENLRGMGALSNQEGEAATKAVQRMSTSSSEAEFKAAAKDFNEVIQRGIDRNRVKLGQPPLYGTPAASETAKQAESKPAKLSADDRKAIEWARQNPDDPRAKQIKQRLGL